MVNAEDAKVRAEERGDRFLCGLCENLCINAGSVSVRLRPLPRRVSALAWRISLLPPVRLLAKLFTIEILSCSRWVERFDIGPRDRGTRSGGYFKIASADDGNG